MTPFLIVLGIFIGLPIGLYLIIHLTPFGWEDDAGFHRGFPDSPQGSERRIKRNRA